jgi:hypothetical protein
VFAVFTLARTVFRSARIALLACFLQILFYISSAFPFRSAGWTFFVRGAQDKAIACFIVVPVAAALALRMLGPSFGGRTNGRRRNYTLFLMAVVTLVLVHPMGPVWCGLFVVPFTMLWWLRNKTPSAARTAISLMLPFLLCGILLAFGRWQVGDELQPEQVPPPRAAGVLSSIYLPGEEVASIEWEKAPFETAHPVVWVLADNLKICNPVYITRYPLAVTGLILSILLVRDFRSRLAARFLACSALATLFLAFTPVGTLVVAGVLNWELLYRLTWILPWGLVLAYCISRGFKSRWQWLIVAIVLVALARGNPANYARGLASRRLRNRPSPELVDALGALRMEPAPQGIVLTSEVTGRKIAAFLPEAHPVTYRGEGPLDAEDLKQLLDRRHLGRAAVDSLLEKQVSYILLRKKWALASALREDPTTFALLHENASYSVWRVSATQAE